MRALTERQLELAYGNIPESEVTVGELIELEKILIECGYIEMAMDLQRYYHRLHYSMYTPRQFKIMAGTAIGLSTHEVETLIRKVEGFEGIEAAAALYDKYEYFLTGVRPYHKNDLTIREAAELINAISHWETNWQLDDETDDCCDPVSEDAYDPEDCFPFEVPTEDEEDDDYDYDSYDEKSDSLW